MYWLRRDQIAKLREFSSIEDILDENGIIKPTNESKILKWHFGIVPWVLTEKIAIILAGMNPYISLETSYKQALKPWNKINFRGWKEEPEIYISWEKNIGIISMANVSGRNLNQYPIPKEYNQDDIISLDAHLLQSWDFRLATSATTLNPEGIFTGHYSIPEDYTYLTETWLPFSFMKEVANQIIALSYSITNNPNWVHAGSTILLASSHISKIDTESPIKISGSDTIIVTGKAQTDPNNPKRWLIAEYTAYTNEIPLFKWSIQGTKVPTKIITKTQ